jgi:DNA-binding transcriptional MerR regulator
MKNHLPTYQDLFGQLDFKQGEDARSVYSPAAYLADLLQLVDDYFEDADLSTRRPDLKQLVLSRENTYGVLPYLDIVNGILESIVRGNVQGDAYEKLKQAKYPFHLPFDLHHERLFRYLHYLKVNPVTLYKAFSTNPDNDTIARISLEISESAYEMAEPVVDEAAIKAYFNLSPGDLWEPLQMISTFMAVTGLSAVEVRDLLYGRLSAASTAPDGESEQREASFDFLHKNLNTRVILDASEERLVLADDNNTDQFSWSVWFERANRLIRMARRLRMSISDCNLILRSCCDSELNKAALQKFAIVRHLRTQFDLSVEEACALLSTVNTLGLGDETEPTDLFNTTFNGKWAKFDKQYLSGSTYTPDAYTHYERIEGVPDLLDDKNEGIRKRIRQALGISSGDLEGIVKRIRARAEKPQNGYVSRLQQSKNVDLAAFSLLYRTIKVCQLLETTPDELFDLFDIIENDPGIRQYSSFETLTSHLTVNTPVNMYAVWEGEDIMTRAWLLQQVCAIIKWSQHRELTIAEIKTILSGERQEKKTVKKQILSAETPDLKTLSQIPRHLKDRIDAFDNLYQQFSISYPSESSFVSMRFDTHTSRIIYEQMRDNSTLLSDRNEKIVIYSEEEALNTGRKAVVSLTGVSKSDFLGLGLSDNLLDQLFNQLVFMRYIETDGSLIAENFPTDAADFSLGSDFSGLEGIIFKFLNHFYQLEAEAGKDPVELFFFITDLGKMSYTELQKTEIQHRLLYNGYLDTNGQVLDPEFFADEANAEQFSLSLNFEALSDQIHLYITKKINDFRTEKLNITADNFNDLPLTAEGRNDLLKNLRFNGYLDQDNNFTDKEAILKMQADDLRLALSFYPYRTKILQTLQSSVEDYQEAFFRLKKEHLADMADDLTADLLLSDLEERGYLQEGEILDEHLRFFLDAGRIEEFQLDIYFSEYYRGVIFQQLTNIADTISRYRFIYNHLADLKFSEESFEALCDTLEGYGFLSNRYITEEALDYFLNPSNSIDLDIEGFEDFGERVFATLHRIALEVNGAATEANEIVRALAEEQDGILYEGIAEVLGIDVSLVRVLCDLIIPGEHPVEAFMAPILASADALGNVTTLPKDRQFNSAYERIEQFALLCSKLQLTDQEAKAVFLDQGLSEKYGENISLPAGLTKIDALLEHSSGKVYVFSGDRYHAFSGADYTPIEKEQNVPLTALSDAFIGAGIVDAAFTDAQGRAWIVSGKDFYCQNPGETAWKKKEGKILGKVENDFTRPDKIEAVLTNAEGQVFLFAGDQFIRYSGMEYSAADEGYPKPVEDNWMQDLGTGELPPDFQEGIDALLRGRDDKTYFFKGKHFISSENREEELRIADYWGLSKIKYEGNEPVDAAFIHNDRFVMLSGNRVLQFSDSIENPNVQLDEGFPKLLTSFIPGLPEEFADGVDAGFKETGGALYLFKGERSVRISPDLTTIEENTRIGERWGVVENVLTSGSDTVSAAFDGLDGCTYIFSGHQYYRYSKDNYARVDEGYPKNIAGNWGGLTKVDAAFVMDGKTWLFGPYPSSGVTGAPLNGYVCYSSKDYTKADEGFPKEVNDNWWNLPFSLIEQDGGFTKPDATLTASDGNTYLFSGKRYIYFEKNERWWSKPKNITEKWAGLPDNFEKIEAAFSGKDDKTYLFFGDSYIRYTGSDFTQAEEGHPRKISELWGRIENNIQRREVVDAAIFMEAEIPVKTESGTPLTPPATEKVQYTYLLSGSQYVRYKNRDYARVEEGYPKSLKELKNEPRFDKFEFPLEKGFDAGCATSRMVYLFSGDRFYANADRQHKTYPDLLPQPAKAAFMEGGKLFIDDGSGWKHYTGLETQPVAQIAEPGLLQNVPEAFRTQLDTVLRGTDGNTYLFKGPQCYNLLLEKSYPLAEEWGRQEINIQMDKGIDAIFEGLDGKIYVFSGHQYQTYTLPRISDPTGSAKQTKISYVLPEFADGYPRLIQEDFGLDSVAIAYVHQGKTYLFEAADEEGRQRCLMFADTEYLKKEKATLYDTDIFWWNIPQEYIEEGFECVDAVLLEEDNMFLIHNNEFIQYNIVENLWSFPKPLERVWRNMPFDEHRFKTVKTAFRTGDGTYYFFSDKNFVTYRNGVPDTLTPLTARWGRLKNNIQQLQKTDAAFVFNGNTYLFSGDQYVRYSGSDYEFTDADYPKSIVGNLRKEAGFALLPESFEATLKEMFEGPSPKIIDEIESDGRNLYLFTGREMHVFASEIAQETALVRLGRLRNNLQQGKGIDAAWVNLKGHTLLFSGDQYYRYSGRNYQWVDEGYPKQIHPHFAQEEDLPALPTAFQKGVDAAFLNKNGLIFFFKDQQFYSSASTVNPQPIHSTWGKIKNDFLPADGVSTGFVDALFVGPDGYTYAFKGAQYVRYEDFDNEYADAGFPRLIRDNWGNMPPAFEAGIDGAFVFEGKTYLTKGEEYIRYSDASYRKVDPHFPQRMAARWTNMADYLLTDIHQIVEYKALADRYNDKAYSLTDFLNAIEGADYRPYEVLADIFDEPSDNIKWLKRHNGFLPEQGALEQRFNLELVLRIHHIITLCRQTGDEPGDVYALLWSSLFRQSSDLGVPLNSDVKSAADTAFKYLSLVNTEQDWKVLQRQLRDEFNEKKRDALTPYVILLENAKIQDPKQRLENTRDLYSKLLIDVDMGSLAEISKIKEAIAAVQLYIHRYLVNLERVGIRGEEDLLKNLEIKHRWEWLKNYRVWEANRKVFLYPENYLRPELRDDKTPAFKTLEDDLLQGEMSGELVEIAYKKYLDEYTEVSRLTIAGGHVFEHNRNGATDLNLILFGRTKTDPIRYYYRTANFLDGVTENASWGAWMPVDIPINANRVYPVFAFGRVFVFWATLEERVKTGNSSQMQVEVKGKIQEVKNTTPVDYCLQIYFTFYDLNKKWKTPQLLKAKDDGSINGVRPISIVSSNLPIVDFRLHVESSKELRGTEHENIVVSCAYKVEYTVFTGLSKRSPEGVEFPFPLFPIFNKENRDFTVRYYFTPEFYVDKINEERGGNVPMIGAGHFAHIFPGESMDDKRIVALSNPTDSDNKAWFCFDHKGGSFLAKPVRGNLNNSTQAAALLKIKGNVDNLPEWDSIDAAFEVNGISYYFNNQKKVYVTSKNLTEEKPISKRWGRRQIPLISADTIFQYKQEKGPDGYVAFSGDQYMLLSDMILRPLSENTLGFPRTGGVDAALSLGNKTWYFSKGQFISNDALSTSMPVDQHWLLSEDIGALRSAFVSGNRTCFLGQNRFFRYEGNNYQILPVQPEKRQNRLSDILKDLGFDFRFGEKIFDRSDFVKSVLSVENALLFITDEDIYRFANGSLEKLNSIAGGQQKVLIGRVQHTFSDDGTLVQSSAEITAATTEKSKQDFVIHHVFGTDAAGNVYLLSRDALVRVAKQEVDTILMANSRLKPAEQAKALTASLRELLKSTHSQRKTITAAFRWNSNQALFFGDFMLVLRDGALQDAQFLKRSVEAAFAGLDNRIYLFSGGQCINLSLNEAAPATLVQAVNNWTNPQTTRNQWGRTVWAKDIAVSAAFAHDGKVCLIKGREFCAFDPDTKIALSSHPKSIRELRNFNKAMPSDWENVNAAFRWPDAKGTLHLINKDSVVGSSVSKLSDWLFEQGSTGSDLQTVDAAYSIENKGVYLMGNSQLHFHPLRNGDPDLGMAEGFPIALNLNSNAKIDSALHQDGITYWFNGSRYSALGGDALPLGMVGLSEIRNGWQDLPDAMYAGFDAALNRSDGLFFFKGGQYVKFKAPHILRERSSRLYNQYDIVRLTASTGTHLNKRLFMGGLGVLLSKATQELDELPKFSTSLSDPTTLQYLADRVRSVPVSSHLDFGSANGIYYREIFFHIPYLLAQCLGAAQKFAEAKRWFEYIYDPTDKGSYWHYLPFLSDDIEAIVENGLEYLEASGTSVPADFGENLRGLLEKLKPLVRPFQGKQPFSEEAKKSLKFLEEANAAKDKPSGDPQSPYQLLNRLKDQAKIPAAQSLIELLHLIGELPQRWSTLNGSVAEQIKAYLDDPFDPHTIAKLRPLAYRKAIVMAYVDNLINWGDLLFRQYTHESINEARMLYVLAYDLLGKKPENLGTRLLSNDQSYEAASSDLNKTADYDFLLDFTNDRLDLSIGGQNLSQAAAVSTQVSVARNPYFYVPDNYLFHEYWNRVEDRLYKIRQSLNILGIRQELPLFDPPIDPMALVQAVAGGMSVGAALSAQAVEIPPYRFSSMISRAKELAGQLGQLGDALLGALEKKDSEEMALLQSRQEAVILKMSRNVKLGQLEAARQNTAQLRESLTSTQYRQKHFEGLIDEGILPLEKGQMAIIGVGGGLMTASAILKVASSIASAAPDAHLGLFIMGASHGGGRISGILENAAEALETGGDGISMFAEIPGIIAGVERMKSDWGLEVASAKSEIRQLEFQIKAAEIQERLAEYDINQLEKDIEHNTAVADFLRDKFSNAQLYQWMAGRLSTLYAQTYILTLDLARQAQKAYQFERGAKESEVNFIQPMYWDGQRQGLLAAQHLSLDLARMEMEFMRTDARRLEINKPISLLEHDPLAWLELKTKGVCEFYLGESLFDYDFPGHYCRQISDVKVTFDIEPGLHRTVFATLTQLSHQTVLTPDPKAVKYLLDPKDQPPLNIRSDWRSGRQIATSGLKEDNGILDPYPDKERYMHFEGTGAVSRWRLELNGKRGDVDISLLEDVIINVEYSALNGGQAFADNVRGMLKPYPATVLLDVEVSFPEAWGAFLNGENEDLILPVSRALCPNMDGGKITNVYTHIEKAEADRGAFVLNDKAELTLRHAQALSPEALSIASRGSEWILQYDGDRSQLINLTLVLGYRAAVK